MCPRYFDIDRRLPFLIEGSMFYVSVVMKKKIECDLLSKQFYIYFKFLLNY